MQHNKQPICRKVDLSKNKNQTKMLLIVNMVHMLNGSPDTKLLMGSSYSKHHSASVYKNSFDVSIKLSGYSLQLSFQCYIRNVKCLPWLNWARFFPSGGHRERAERLGVVFRGGAGWCSGQEAEDKLYVLRYIFISPWTEDQLLSQWGTKSVCKLTGTLKRKTDQKDVLVAFSRSILASQRCTHLILVTTASFFINCC